MTKEECRFSVIMAVYEKARELEESLTDFLTQAYEPGYEVIVVDESSTDNTEDVLKLFKQEYPQLYTTFLPKPNRNITRRRLALSIGVKASENEWVIFTDIHKKPTSPNWLNELADSIDGSSKVMLGYFRKKGTRLQIFDEVWEANRQIRKAERKRANGHEGKRLKYLRGKYDFIVVRRDYAHDLLKFFEQDISLSRLLGLRLSIMCHNIQ